MIYLKKLPKISFFILIFILSFFSVSPSLISFASQEKVIYLTFDDGPSKGPCNEVLDVLKSENVLGTFFILGNEINGNEDTLKRIYSEGHSIGLHSMTHERNNLYNNDSDFLKEMLQVQETIEKVTGYKSTILRFPFGCNNNTYKLKKSLVNLLHENNFKIYDWTQDSKDGEYYSSSPEVFYKASISKDSNVVLLMHCGTINKNSPKALGDIIKYYKNQNYVFKTISNDTPEVFHYIK